jgi:hypothetical protein
MINSYNHSCGACYFRAIRKLLVVALATILAVLCGSVGLASAEKNEHLFFIERSKNKNIVYYDVCHNDNNKLCESNPVTAYWILDGGKREGLSSLEKKYAFGIKSLHPQSDIFRFSVAALAKNTISIEMIEGKYRAATYINNREIVLEKVYVNTKEGLFGMSTVKYIEYTGKTMQEKTPVKIRVVPD